MEVEEANIRSLLDVEEGLEEGLFGEEEEAEEGVGVRWWLLILGED